MEYKDGYIINPQDFRKGTIYMSPFETNDAFVNKELLSGVYNVDNDPVVEFYERFFSITESATKALELSLNDLQLKPDDEVWIITTSGNKYISSCVTRTIEMFCKWSRQKTEKTAVILVNHEFGFLYEDIAQLKEHNLPIIEDKAYSMYSFYNDDKNNFFGDYIILSMAKMFPMQSGGLLYAKKGIIFQKDLSIKEVEYYKTCFTCYNDEEDYIRSMRLYIFNYIREKMLPLKLLPRFIPKTSEVPGAYLFYAKEGRNIDYPKLKQFMQNNGVECSVFYGEEAFYFPCHQKMTENHVDYIITLIKNFLK
ncbi:MAG: hypothetical protein FWH18_01000 [Marinilabiliaceae bacterium]|nr:hypothetical protein [Marinilabiliaceae bacterium]